jgi:SAM-dependent methyltransferase
MTTPGHSSPPATTYRGFNIAVGNGGFTARRDGERGAESVISALTRTRVQSEIDAFLDDPGGCALPVDVAHIPGLLNHGVDPDRLQSVDDLSLADGAAMRARGIDRLIVLADDPASWLLLDAEKDALALGLALEVVFPDARRVYRAHDLGRLRYLKSYLASMLTVTGRLDGRRMLEVGCSDGLSCDLLMRLGAASVDGLDTLADVGARYQTDGRIAYHRMDGRTLAFDDRSFDVVLSIATMEHVAVPAEAMAEMLRVAAGGGVVYVQAGPLYHSPFGHHMFGYFDDLPWIHLRRTEAEIVEEGCRRGLDVRLRAERGMPFDRYVQGMLARTHLNGLRLTDYGLDTLQQRAAEILLWSPSYEGDDLLTDSIVAEIPGVPRECLTEHGFELAVRGR